MSNIAQDWREQISQENEQKVANMTEEELARERQEILERFGEGISNILKKAKAARLKTDLTELDEGMLNR